MENLFNAMPEHKVDPGSASPRDDNRLESWGEIAAFFDRSPSTVQRWEKKERLPVHRHNHEKSDSVFAYRHELEAWRSARQTDAEVRPNPTVPPVEERLTGTQAKDPVVPVQALKTTGPIPVPWLIAIGSAGAVLVATLALSLYGDAILAFAVSVVFIAVGYAYLSDSVLTRTCVAIFIVAAMSFIPSAWTMPDVMASVINIHTLKPAVAYPFVTGLRFVPIPTLVLAYWTALRLRQDQGFLNRPRLGRAYIALGILFLLITAMAIMTYYGDDRIWRARLPGREMLLAGYIGVFAMNVAIGWLGYSFFRKDVIRSYRPLFAAGAMAYLLLSVPAVLVDWQYNRINKHYLDQRRSEAYRVLRPEAIADLRSLEPALASQIGPDLRTLLVDPDFVQALRTKRFYKQTYDEPFQGAAPAVMFGYQSDGPRNPPNFVIVRLPDQLAGALGFRPVGEE